MTTLAESSPETSDTETICADVFEGPEKKLEVYFSRGDDNSGLRRFQHDEEVRVFIMWGSPPTRPSQVVRAPRGWSTMARGEGWGKPDCSGIDMAKLKFGTPKPENPEHQNT